LMRRRGVGAVELAKAIEVDPATLYRYRTGARPVPSDVLERLCEALGTHPNFLLGIGPLSDVPDLAEAERMREAAGKLGAEYEEYQRTKRLENVKPDRPT